MNSKLSTNIKYVQTFKGTIYDLNERSTNIKYVQTFKGTIYDLNERSTNIKYVQTSKGTIYDLNERLHTVDVSDWSSCSVSCGNGKRSRVASCISLHSHRVANYTCTYQEKCEAITCIGRCKYNTFLKLKRKRGNYVNTKNARKCAPYCNVCYVKLTVYICS